MERSQRRLAYICSFRTWEWLASEFIWCAPREITEQDYEIASTLLLGLSLVLVALTEASLDITSAWVNVEGFKPLLGVLTIAVILDNMKLSAMAHLERDLDFRRIAMLELSGQILYYLIAGPMVFLGFSAWSLVAAFFAQQGFLCIATFRAAGLKPRLAWNWPAARSMLVYSTDFRPPI